MKKILSYLFILGLLLGIVVVYTGYKKIGVSVSAQDKEIFISKNDNYESVQAKLNRNSYIKDKRLFEFLANKMNLKNHIHPGKYKIPKGLNIVEIIRKLRSNRQEPIKLIINNVNFKTDLAHKISRQLDIDSTAFLNFLNDKEKLESLHLNPDNIMCQFIPNTYEMYWSPNITDFFARMQNENDKFWNKKRLALAKEKQLTTDEVFILASIVEKEYKHKSELERIAGVYLNRINIKMPLQADPTCKFAWGDLSIKRVLNIHTKNPHPYNTYYISGLPPGPICLPETTTIDAVLNAEKHAFLYFCAHEDLNGKHKFNTTLSGHLRAARKYQKALNKLKIY